MTPTAEYGREVRRVLILTLALNVIVVGAKLVAGVLAGSLSVISDAAHSSADSLNNVVGLVIIRLASAAPDAEHPHGHHKFETLGAFGIAAFLTVTAFEVASGAVKRLVASEPAHVEVTTLTFGVMIATLATNLFVWWFEGRRGRALNSSFLLADAKHTLSDIYVTGPVLAGLVVLELGIADLDAPIALGVAGAIAYAAYQIFASTIPVLVDSAPLSAEHAAAVVRATPGVVSVHDVLSRGVPGKIFVSMHLVVSTTDAVAAHAVTEQVEARLAQAFGPCHAVIHVEPHEWAR